MRLGRPALREAGDREVGEVEADMIEAGVLCLPFLGNLSKTRISCQSLAESKESLASFI